MSDTPAVDTDKLADFASSLDKEIDAHKARLVATLVRFNLSTAEELAVLDIPALDRALDEAVEASLKSKSAYLSTVETTAMQLAACLTIAEGGSLPEDALESITSNAAVQAVLALRKKADSFDATNGCLSMCKLAAEGMSEVELNDKAPSLFKNEAVQAVLKLRSDSARTTPTALNSPLTAELASQLVQAEAGSASTPAVVDAAVVLCRYMTELEGAYFRAISDNSIKDTLLVRQINDRRAARGQTAHAPGPHIGNGFRSARSRFLAEPTPASLAELAGSVA